MAKITKSSKTGTRTALKRAIGIVGLSPLADALGVSPQVVSNWRKRKSVPARYVLRIEAATEGKVLAHELDADTFPKGFCAAVKAPAA